MVESQTGVGADQADAARRARALHHVVPHDGPVRIDARIGDVDADAIGCGHGNAVTSYPHVVASVLHLHGGGTGEGGCLDDVVLDDQLRVARTRCDAGDRTDILPAEHTAAYGEANERVHVPSHAGMSALHHTVQDPHIVLVVLRKAKHQRGERIAGGTANQAAVADSGIHRPRGGIRDAALPVHHCAGQRGRARPLDSQVLERDVVGAAHAHGG